MKINKTYSNLWCKFFLCLECVYDTSIYSLMFEMKVSIAIALKYYKIVRKINLNQMETRLESCTKHFPYSISSTPDLSWSFDAGIPRIIQPFIEFAQDRRKLECSEECLKFM